jgi:hypothetical protein
MMMAEGYMMGMGWAGLVWMLLVGALVAVPFWRLLPQFGIPAWVALLAVFPLIALILLWVMAFVGRRRDGAPVERV